MKKFYILVAAAVLAVLSTFQTSHSASAWSQHWAPSVFVTAIDAANSTVAWLSPIGAGTAKEYLLSWETGWSGDETIVDGKTSSLDVDWPSGGRPTLFTVAQKSYSLGSTIASDWGFWAGSDPNLRQAPNVIRSASTGQSGLTLTYTWKLNSAINYTPEWYPTLKSGSTGTQSIGVVGTYPRGVTTVQPGIEYSITYSGLNPAESYFFAVSGRNYQSPSTQSDWINFGVSGSQTVAKISAPTAIWSATNASETVSWTTPSVGASEVTGYEIEMMKLVSGDGFSAIPSTDRSFDVSGFPGQNTPGMFAVAAVDSVGNRGDWSVAAASWPSLRTAPTVWVSDRTQTSITYSWTLGFTPNFTPAWAMNFLSHDFSRHTSQQVTQVGNTYSTTFENLLPFTNYSFGVTPYNATNANDTTAWTNYGIAPATQVRTPDAAVSFQPLAAIGDSLANSPVLISGVGLEPSSAWKLELASTIRTVGGGTTSGTGKLSDRLILPANIEPGQHHLILTTVQANGTSTSTVTEIWLDSNGRVLSVGGPPNKQSLAATGNNVLLPAGIAVGVLSIGVAVLFARRKNRTVRP